MIELFGRGLSGCGEKKGIVSEEEICCRRGRNLGSE